MRTPTTIFECPPLGIGIKAKLKDDAGNTAAECPPLGIGIKAKQPEPPGAAHRGVSAPRNWNQGKAQVNKTLISSLSVRPSELESRQSHAFVLRKNLHECPPLGIGIKAKLIWGLAAVAVGVSAPRNWNQGKACARCSSCVS